MHGEVALGDGSTAMMVFRNRRYGEVTQDEDAESEGCPRSCLSSWQSADKRNEVPDGRADILNARELTQLVQRCILLWVDGLLVTPLERRDALMD